MAKGESATYAYNPLTLSMSGLALFALFVYLVSVPFYLFPSGTPQPSDFILCFSFLAFALQCLYSGRLILAPEYRAPALCLALFVFVVLVVNLVWMAIMASPAMTVYSLFYIFNLLAFLLVLSLHTTLGSEVLRLVSLGCAASVCIQAVLSPFVAVTLNQAAERQVLFFNNPNQLGYYAILSASILSLGKERSAVSNSIYVIAMMAATWLVSLSLSKAALVALLFLLIVELWRGRILVPISTFATAGLILLFNIDDIAVIDRVVERLGAIGRDADDSVSGRGYDRIWNHPWHLLLGAGEGETSRFSVLAAGSRELHSTFGTIFFSYGLPAILLLLLLAFLVISRVRLILIAYVFPAAIYGLTHNGTRETLLWILFALVVGSACVLPSSPEKDPRELS